MFRVSTFLKGIYIYFETCYSLPSVYSKMYMQRLLVHSKELGFVFQNGLASKTKFEI